MSDTPRTDAALNHSGASHMDVIIRLERLIEVSRQIERENTRLRQIILKGTGGDVNGIH